MKKFYCKLQVTLNKYKGIPCESVEDAEYVYEAEQIGVADGYHDGNYKLTTYHNGKPSDLDYNGWQFSSFNQGTFHFPGSYSYVGIDIDCCDPNGSTIRVHNSTLLTDDFYTEGAALYMNKVMFVCLFKSVDEYESVGEYLQKNYKEVVNSTDKLKHIIKKLPQFKDVISRNECNPAIPPHFIANAKMEYKQIVSFLKDNVGSEKIIDVLFE